MGSRPKGQARAVAWVTVSESTNKSRAKSVYTTLGRVFPRTPNCPVCNNVKHNRAQCRTKAYSQPDALPKPLKFADSITADHKILNEDDATREKDQVALIILDRYSRWLQGYGCKSKTAVECEKFFKRFVAHNARLNMSILTTPRSLLPF